MRLIRRNLDQVPVWIAAIYRRHRPERASPLNRALQDLYTVVVEMTDNFIRRRGGDETHIGGPGIGADTGRPGANISVDRPQIDFLPSEFQRSTLARAELLALHSQHALIPRGADLYALAVDHDVVDPVDGEPHQPRPL